MDREFENIRRRIPGRSTLNTTAAADTDYSDKGTREIHTEHPAVQ